MSNEGGVPIYVNVYDMNAHNKYWYPIGLGIYHSGIEIMNQEFCFGGHSMIDMTGVFKVVPRVGPPGVFFRQTILMGYTKKSFAEIKFILEEISQDFKGRSYHLLHRNCNHFVERVSVALLEKYPPKWINRLAYLGTWIPCIPSIGPLEDEISSFQGPFSDNPVIFQDELERKQLLDHNS